MGVNGAETGEGAHIQTSIISTLQFLFCDHDKSIFLASLGLKDMRKQHNLCPFIETVAKGAGKVSLTLGGVRRSLKEKETETSVQLAYETNKWEGNEYVELDKQFQLEQDRAGGGAIYAVEATTEDDENKDKDNKEKDKENNDREKEQAQAHGGKEKDQEEEYEMNIVVDMSVLLDPPQLKPKVHFNAHKNLAWTTWNVTWPVVRLSMHYLEEAWNLRSGFDDVKDDDIFDYGVYLMQQDMTSYLNDNIDIKVMDVMLEDVLQEPVRVSPFGHALSTYTHDIPILEEPVPVNESPLDYNITADEVASISYHPSPRHPLRLLGVTMFLITLKCVVILAWLSSRRKAARDAENKRLKANKGLLHSPEGVDEMLGKAKSAPRSLYKGESQDAKLRQSEDDEQAYEVRIPMPSALKS